eukprot:s192_g50.t1
MQNDQNDLCLSKALGCCWFQHIMYRTRQPCSLICWILSFLSALVITSPDCFQLFGHTQRRVIRPSGASTGFRNGRREHRTHSLQTQMHSEFNRMQRTQKTQCLSRGELMEETKMLRETLGSLTQEVRLLRELLDPPSTAPAEKVETVTTPVNHPEQDAPARKQTTAVKGEESKQRAAKSPQRIGTTNLKVVSAGGDAGDIADFFVEDQKVPIGGMSNRRGLNVVIIDTSMGQVLSAKTYDIWGNPMEENRRLAKDFRAIEEDSVVLVALKDSGMENLDGEALHALQSIGSTLEGRLAFRQGYALIGVKDGEALAERKGPMVMAEATWAG